MSLEVIADLGSGVFQIQEKELEWSCVECLATVHDTGAGYFECECGPCFVVSIVGPFVSPTGPRLLVSPESPCFEPEPEA